MSVPRDVDVRVTGNECVTLVDIIDDLAADDEAGRVATAAIAGLRRRAERIRRAELERMRHRWDGLSGADRERLEALTRNIVDALLREPAAGLRAAAEAGDAALVARMGGLVGLGTP